MRSPIRSSCPMSMTALLALGLGGCIEAADFVPTATPDTVADTDAASAPDGRSRADGATPPRPTCGEADRVSLADLVAGSATVFKTSGQVAPTGKKTGVLLGYDYAVKLWDGGAAVLLDPPAGEDWKCNVPVAVVETTCEPLEVGIEYLVQGRVTSLPASWRSGGRDTTLSPSATLDVETWCMRSTPGGLAGTYEFALYPPGVPGACVDAWGTLGYQDAPGGGEWSLTLESLDWLGLVGLDLNGATVREGSVAVDPSAATVSVIVDLESSLDEYAGLFGFVQVEVQPASHTMVGTMTFPDHPGLDALVAYANRAAGLVKGVCSEVGR